MSGVLDLPTLIQKVRLEADTADGEKDATNAVGRLGNTLAKTGKALSAAVTVPIVGLAVAGVKAASDLNESVSKTDVVFGSAAAAVHNFAKSSAKDLGLSRQEAEEGANTFGNLFRALGTGQQPAADMSVSLVKLSSDLASFNNADPSDVLLAMRSGLLGEAEPLRQFGVSLSAARIEAEALSSGLVKATGDSTEIAAASIAVEKANQAAAKALKEHGQASLEYRTATAAVATAEAHLADVTKGKVPELNAAQKAQAAYLIIQKDTALAQGDFARTSGGLANQQRILAAQFTDFKAALGTFLLPILLPVVHHFTAWFQAFQGLNPETQKMIGVALALAATLGPLLIIVGKLASSFSSIKTVFSGASLFGGFLPIALAIGAAGYLIWKNWDKVRPIFQGIADFLGPLVSAFSRFWTALTTGFTQNEGGTWFERLGLALHPLIDFIRDHATIVVAGLAAAFLALTSPIILVVGGIAALVAGVIYAYTHFETFRDIVDSVVAFFRDVVGPVVATVVGYLVEQIGHLVDWFQEIWPSVSEAFGHVQVVIQDFVNFVRPFVEGFLGALAVLWRAWGDDIWHIVQSVFRLIGETLNAFFDIFRNLFKFFIDLINGDWGKAWNDLLGIFRGFWDLIFATLRGAWNILKGLLGGIVSIFGEVLRPLGNFLHTWIVQPFEDVLDFVKSLPGRIHDYASGMWDGIKHAFVAAINFIIRGWNAIQFKIPGFDLGPIHWSGFTLGLPDIPLLNDSSGGDAGSGRAYGGGGARFAALGGPMGGDGFFAGERGVEWVDLGSHQSAQVFGADRTRRMLGEIASGIASTNPADSTSGRTVIVEAGAVHLELTLGAGLDVDKIREVVEPVVTEAFDDLLHRMEMENG